MIAPLPLTPVDYLLKKVKPDNITKINTAIETQLPKYGWVRIGLGKMSLEEQTDLVTLYRLVGWKVREINLLYDDNELELDLP